MHEDRYVMCVGLTCLDIVSYCHHYPEEDTDHRCESIRWHRGGNASNSCTVLSLLGATTECMTCLAQSPQLPFLQSDLLSYGINTDHCVLVADCSCPTSVCLINTQNGSRTICHSNTNLPEISFENFKNIDLKKYKWIHFEGRRTNVEDICEMLSHVDAYNATVSTHKKVITSVELEKQSKNLDILIDKADYVFISKDYAYMHDLIEKDDAAIAMTQKTRPGAVVVVAWGDDGAVAMSKSGDISRSAAFIPDRVVDTLGAGDTFNAAFILAVTRNASLDQAVTFACKVAGAKCGFTGFDKLKGMQTSL